MGRIFLVSDTHFGHDRAFLYEPRGFSNIADHDEAVIQNWNSVVQPDDTVYHLGDVMLNDNDHGMDCLRRLNGNIIIIPFFKAKDWDLERLCAQATLVGPEAGGLAPEPVHRAVLPVSMAHTDSPPTPKAWVSTKPND